MSLKGKCVDPLREYNRPAEKSHLHPMKRIAPERSATPERAHQAARY
jgi:hypothetical protein